MTHPTSCPGCGAPHEPACRYCGRRSVTAAPLDRWRGSPLVDGMVLPYGCFTMSDGRIYYPPGKWPERPIGFWRSLLGGLL